MVGLSTKIGRVTDRLGAGTAEVESFSLSRTGGKATAALLAATTRDGTAVVNAPTELEEVFVETGSAEIGDVRPKENLGYPGTGRKNVVVESCADSIVVSDGLAFSCLAPLAPTCTHQGWKVLA